MSPFLLPMKGNRFDQNFDARQILWQNGINPFTGVENLVWAPNWKHSSEYANNVLVKLNSVSKVGQKAIGLALKSIAASFAKGDIKSVALPEDEDDDV